MTTDKGIKRVVRARMAKTGERYVAARRALLDPAASGPTEPMTTTSTGDRLRGGLHPETSVVANVLANGAAAAVEAAEMLHAAVMAGEAGRSRVLAAAETVWSIRERYADTFPQPAERVAAILADLGDRVGAIHQAEVEALEVTARAIGR